MRDVTVNLYDFLDFALSELTGSESSRILDFIAEHTGFVSDEEIQEFSDWLEEINLYNDEDKKEAVQKLTEWRDKHVQVKKVG